uniref:YIF1b n=1 Tax=Oryza nivara TaxID=4536 RepID=A0A0E0HTL3_ORYNI
MIPGGESAKQAHHEKYPSGPSSVVFVGSLDSTWDLLLFAATRCLPLLLPPTNPSGAATPPVRRRSMAAMNNDLGGLGGRPATSQANPFESALYGAGPGLIRSGLGAYGEKFLGSSSEFMQSNITQYLSNPQYYFQVNSQYVRNKLKVILFPFLHRGHWTRITEPVGGRLSYKPPIQDINAPDLYIPLMAFGTYVVIAGYALGVLGRFTPEALTLQFTKGLLGWFLQVILIRVLLYTLGSGEAPLLDIVAYAGYGFAGTSLAMLVRVFWSPSYYFVLPWFSICTGVFLVKTMKRVLLGAPRSYERHPSRNHYFLLFLAVVQFPMLFWLGNISG